MADTHTVKFVGIVYEPRIDSAGKFELLPFETTITIQAKSTAQARRIFAHYGMERLTPTT